MPEHKNENDEWGLEQLDEHFVFNALNTIKCAVIIDDHKACSLINNIADYMRYRLQTIRRCELVSFSEELKHLRAYIQLECARYSQVQVDFEINDDGFMIPAMSTVFLVENAIRHGLCGRGRKGNIVVRSWKYNNHYYVEIQDDGVGFEYNEDEINYTNFGSLGNVIDRIQQMNSGAVDICSEHGKGTKVRLILPEMATESQKQEG